MNNAENDSDSRTHGRNSSGASGYYSQAEKRAHHNALERKRRDHIKDSFTSLRDSVPALQGEKVASRAQILKKAAEYIQFMRRKNNSHQQDIDDLKRQNNLLESQKAERVVVDYSSTRPFVTLSIIKMNMNLEYEFQFQHGKEGVKNDYTYISVEYEHESPLHIILRNGVGTGDLWPALIMR
ncbi:hypothetical protein MSG28_006919 [Choristoneura fumiferana]|uniref:Uncharacterized protein n=1 Tax=Choristoneura fumiferana TaxID=7141 RepID=A0ACC0JLL6_CHOFU|nr:hypothetical protein MSG28_006919 [Choristoneura fumiferana]